MSNSIWKTPEQKPDKDKPILFLAGVGQVPQKGWYYKNTDKFGNRASKNVHRWAYFDEWLVDIDRAERLQKAVDLAQEHLLSISDGYDIMKADVETIKRLFYAIQDEASETHKEIKQLIKETTNDK